MLEKMSWARKEENLVREVQETRCHLKWVAHTGFMQVVAMLAGSLGQEPPGQREQPNRLEAWVGSPRGLVGGNRTRKDFCFLWEAEGERGQRSEGKGQVVNVTENARAVTPSVMGPTSGF